MPDTIPDCYGELFPDLDDARLNETASGVVFAVRLEGGGMGRPFAQVTGDRDRFLRCTRCPAYGACYDLSMARLAFHSAVHLRFNEDA